MRDSLLDLDGLSPKIRRLLALGIRGGDGDEVDVQVLLDRAANAKDLSDDDLVALKADLKAEGLKLTEEPDDDKLAKAIEVRDAMKAISAVELEREEKAAELAEQAAAIAAELNGEDDTDSGDGEAGDAGDGGDGADGADGGDGGDGGDAGDAGDSGDAGDGGADGGDAATGDADEATEAEKIAASASAARTKARRPNATKPRNVRRQNELVLRASANVPGVPAGMVLDSNDKIIDTVDRALRATGGRYHGPRTEIPLFSLGSWNPEDVFGAERTLGRDAQSNEQKIEAVTSLAALRASGGICAPVPVEYDLPILGTDARPLRDSLARFGAPRGGTRLLPPPSLLDVSGAVGAWTEANDVDPGSDGPEIKPCLTLDCPEETETLVAAITQCLKIGNFRNRFFPEQVRAWTQLVGVSAARFSETRMLQKIGDLSTQIAVTQVLGSTRTVLAALDRRAAGLRSFHRLDPKFPLRLEAPAWLLNNMITDLARELPGSTAERLAMSEGQIEAFFTVRHINVTWLLDGEAGQVFPDQVDGDLNGWPTEVVVYLFVEGTWLHLDAGMIDFGIVRDSVLNSTNDMQMFSEVFEEVAFHGVPGTSARMAIDICPNGETAAAASTTGICLGGS